MDQDCRLVTAQVSDCLSLFGHKSHMFNILLDVMLFSRWLYNRRRNLSMEVRQ